MMIRSWISGVDFAQIAYYTTFIILILGLVPAVFLVWTNGGSRQLGFAAASLAGAIVFFLMNLSYESRPSTSLDQISAELHINRPIRSIKFANDAAETNLHTSFIINPASQWLASNNPIALATEDSNTLTSDLILFSMLVFLMKQEPDWQFKLTEHTGKAPDLSGSTLILQSYGRSPKSLCTVFTGADLRSRLAQAGNLFAAAPAVLDDTAICLPPKTIVELSRENLRIRNPICQLSFAVAGNLGASSARPVGGQPDFETLLVSIRVETTYFRWRAQSSDRDKYREWSTRVISGLKKWLES